jgi:hypothetical protein
MVRWQYGTRDSSVRRAVTISSWEGARLEFAPAIPGRLAAGIAARTPFAGIIEDQPRPDASRLANSVEDRVKLLVPAWTCAPDKVRA